MDFYGGNYGPHGPDFVPDDGYDFDQDYDHGPGDPYQHHSGPRALLASQVLRGGLVQVLVYAATLGWADYEAQPPQDPPYTAGNRTCRYCRRMLWDADFLGIHERWHRASFLTDMQRRSRRATNTSTPSPSSTTPTSEKSNRRGRRSRSSKKAQQSTARDQGGPPHRRSNSSQPPACTPAPGPSRSDNAQQLGISPSAFFSLKTFPRPPPPPTASPSSSDSELEDPPAEQTAYTRPTWWGAQDTHAWITIPYGELGIVEIKIFYADQDQDQGYRILVAWQEHDVEPPP